ncbi:MAG: hypothetical protein RI556_12385 [Hydrogenovibrio sp.]|uniref:head-tail joining protein n=1 Tax=Hydrogenovibrio sp. TaxID=2065821 RepID=UPI00286FD401|nr:hypothetical protein [Hydrogenovibrio sp.]MDR9499967.1 hypothetical protein [Hydrogenovibrio sp.]
MSKFDQAFAGAAPGLMGAFGDPATYYPANGDAISTEAALSHDVEVSGDGYQTSYLATTATFYTQAIPEVGRGDTMTIGGVGYIAEAVLSGDDVMTEIIVVAQ